MARIPFAEVQEGSEVAEIYASIAGLRGSVHNHQRVLANQPGALRAFMGMSRYVREESSLAPRLRELAVLATAYALKVPYEIHYHVPAARRAGVSEEQLAAFPDWAAADCFDVVERTVLSYADQVARRREVDDATFEQLLPHLSLPEMVDLAVTVGFYHMVSAILLPLRIQAE
jgi:AhpD family alkylhydroperoxidase